MVDKENLASVGGVVSKENVFTACTNSTQFQQHEQIDS
jgi:hypothetical protein